LLESLLALDYPDFEILVVDNASDGPETLAAVREFDDPRVRGIREPRAGTSRGRNAALLAAKHEIVAFIDDDVAPEPLWLKGIALGFSRGDDVGLVTGMVPSGELSSAAQGYFEARIAWEVAGRPKIIRLSSPPPNSPMFPFEVGDFGTGANFAVRRDLVISLGGLNEALGPGAPATAGEDIDLFVRMLYAGSALAYEPSAVGWHRHRRDLGDLTSQIRNYGRGFGAWITTVFLDRKMRSDAIRLLIKGMSRTRGMATLEPGVATDLGLDVAALRQLERRALVTGPYWYARSRFDRRSARPLSADRP
jgi:cellulose synthase/poly-beta-1,6-N-acetylglucosamine synthase-like glycosyltransferase